MHILLKKKCIALAGTLIYVFQFVKSYSILVEIPVIFISCSLGVLYNGHIPKTSLFKGKIVKMISNWKKPFGLLVYIKID